MTINSLTGFGEQVDFQLEHSEGYDTARFELSAPVTAGGTVVRLAAERARARVVEEPGRTGEIESDYETAGIEVSHPVYRDETTTAILGVSFEYRRSQTFLLGEPFAFVDGVDQTTGESSVTVVRAFQEARYQGQDVAGAVRSRLTLGTDMLGATVNDTAASGDRLSWLLQARGSLRLPVAQARLLGRADLQIADRRLLPLEQMAAGGATTVRGYRENAVIRDNGVVGSVELRVPLPQVPVPGLDGAGGAGRAEAALFFDYAHLWSSDDAPDTTNPTDQLAGVGAGLIWTPYRGVTAEVYYAAKLQRLDAQTNDDLTDRGIHFKIDVNAGRLLEDAWDAVHGPVAAAHAARDATGPTTGAGGSGDE